MTENTTEQNNAKDTESEDIPLTIPADDEHTEDTPTAETQQDADTDTTNTPEPQSNREARYRRQLRDTEAERDRLAARVEALQRAEVERLAAKTIQKPSAIWAAQTQLADLLDDDGAVDPQKVTKAASAAQQSLGLAAARSGAHVPREGTSLHQHNGSNTWEQAFKR